MAETKGFTRDPYYSFERNQQLYEDLLAREGMPAELPGLISIPAFARNAFEKAQNNSFTRRGEEPTYADIQAAIMDAQPGIESDEAQAIARAIWINSQLTCFSEYDPHAPYHSDADAQDQGDFSRAINRVLPHLQPAQQDILRQFYGIDQDPKTIGEISEETGEEYHKIAAKRQNGLARLRHPRHSYMLGGYIATHDPHDPRYYFRSRYLPD